MPRRNGYKNRKRPLSWKNRVIRAFKDLGEILPAMKRLAFEMFSTLSFLYALYRLARWH